MSPAPVIHKKSAPAAPPVHAPTRRETNRPPKHCCRDRHHYASGISGCGATVSNNGSRRIRGCPRARIGARPLPPATAVRQYQPPQDPARLRHPAGPGISGSRSNSVPRAALHPSKRLPLWAPTTVGGSHYRYSRRARCLLRSPGTGLRAGEPADRVPCRSSAGQGPPRHRPGQGPSGLDGHRPHCS